MWPYLRAQGIPRVDFYYIPCDRGQNRTEQGTGQDRRKGSRARDMTGQDKGQDRGHGRTGQEGQGT